MREYFAEIVSYRCIGRSKSIWRVGTENNLVNMYATPTASYYRNAFNNNGYGGMQYYSSETCGDTGIPAYNGSTWVHTGCTNDYSKSEIKYVVDEWANANILNGLFEARLITSD